MAGEIKILKTVEVVIKRTKMVEVVIITNILRIMVMVGTSNIKMEVVEVIKL